MPPDGDERGEDYERKAHRDGSEREKHAHARGPALAAAEPQPHGSNVSEDSRDRGGSDPAWIVVPLRRRDLRGQQHRERALAEVENERGEEARRAQVAHHVRSADRAAPRLAYVDAAPPAHNQVAEGNRS